MTDLQLANLALGMVGAEMISALDTSSARASLCTAQLPAVRKAVIKSRAWTFATRWARLPELDLSDGYSPFESRFQSDGSCNDPDFPYARPLAVLFADRIVQVRKVLDAAGNQLEWRLVRTPSAKSAFHRVGALTLYFPKYNSGDLQIGDAVTPYLITDPADNGIEPGFFIEWDLNGTLFRMRVDEVQAYNPYITKWPLKCTAATTLPNALGGAGMYGEQYEGFASLQGIDSLIALEEEIAELRVQYSFDPPDSSIIPDDVAQVIATRLASVLAVPLAGSRSAQADLWNLYEQLLKEAATADGVQGSTQQLVVHPASSLLARRAGG